MLILKNIPLFPNRIFAFKYRITWNEKFLHGKKTRVISDKLDYISLDLHDYIYEKDLYSIKHKNCRESKFYFNDRTIRRDNFVVAALVWFYFIKFLNFLSDFDIITEMYIFNA